MRTIVLLLIVLLVAGCTPGNVVGPMPKKMVPPGIHVWQRVEITLHARKAYANSYQDVTVWVDLKGPGFNKRCYGFWDGGDTFRVRVMATAPGAWSWTSGSEPADPGLTAGTGSFDAQPWSDAEKAANPNRRGMIRPSANGHAFQYADGTPFFYLADTWWAASTNRFPWKDNQYVYALGPNASFQDYVAYRKAQQFNGMTILAQFGNWADDGMKADLSSNGVLIRAAWKIGNTTRAKNMTDEQGNRPFFFPGKVPGYEQVFPDVERPNPAYFQSLDRKMDYLQSQGFVPFLEVARRDMGEAWAKFYPWPESYSRFIQYVWSRYQANICFLSPIHYDSPTHLPVEDWNRAANDVIDRYGPPPFGNLCSTNSTRSSLLNWGHTDKARWLGFHQIGNLRNHTSFSLLTDIFRQTPPVPAINGEPYYDGMENQKPGSPEAAMYCRSAMYGSVLSGGLGGHVYGAGGWPGGVWSGEIEPESKFPIWELMQYASADQMCHLKTFIFSANDAPSAYQDLVPCTPRLTPNQTTLEQVRGATGWAFAAATPNDDVCLLFFERDCPPATLGGVTAGVRFAARWFDPQTGAWKEAGTLAATPQGELRLPAFPTGPGASQSDWALKLKRATP
jgi:hypothetical protein